jgi:ABC-type molybdenum transport system ATPase subunit/photorepair protein PhrA
MPDPKATDQPSCWIIAGPNGAGKTTFAVYGLTAGGSS